VSVLEDSCPHQGNPLSTGSVSGNQLWCRHHGWAVGTDGWCERAAAGADSFRVRESEGVVLARDPRS
jgi:phenylpropionate dioxygenase-like ring-hydroxylating dioxygenase large terminal subunit